MGIKIKPGRKSVSRWFWGGFIAVLLAGLLFVLFAAIRGGKQWAEEAVQQSETLPVEWKEVIQVTLSGGEGLYIDSQSFHRIRGQSLDWLASRGKQTRKQMTMALEDRTGELFATAEQQIPAFADWYYSLAGEYTRLFHAAVGDLSEYLVERLEDLIFDPADTAAGVDRLMEEMDGRLTDSLGRVVADFQQQLVQMVHAHQVEEPVAELRVTGHWMPAVGSVEQVIPLLSLSSADLSRQGLATSAGVAAAAAAFKKLGATTLAKSTGVIVAKPSAGLLAALAAKLGIKSTVTGGGAVAMAGAGAASGASLCAGTIVGAPLAPGCALVGGVVTGAAAWLLVDKAVLEVDELVNREQLENQLREALAAQRDDLQATLKVHYLEAAGEGFRQLEQGIGLPPRSEGAEPKRDFIPARAAVGG